MYLQNLNSRYRSKQSRQSLGAMRREKWLAMVRDRTSKEAAGRRVRREGEQGWEREGLVS